MIGPGVARIKIVELGTEVEEIESPSGKKPIIEIKDLKKGEFTVQVGAFKNKANANRLRSRLNVVFDYVEVEMFEDINKGSVYRVRASKSETLTKAGEMEAKLESMGFEGAFIVSL